MRPDTDERLAEALTLIIMIRDAKAEEIRNQHLARLERILEMLRSNA